MLQRLRGLVWPQCSLSGSPVSTIQCPARVGFGQSRSKSEEKVLFTLFEKFKWKQNDLISRSRNESEIKMTGNWDREVKMKWKSFKIKKWNFSRILENFRKFKNYSWHTLFWVLHPPRLVNFFKNLVSNLFSLYLSTLKNLSHGNQWMDTLALVRFPNPLAFGRSDFPKSGGDPV